ncbi:MAG: Ig-like domain-containing protein, partial [Elusimicrobia bacterium]|nr:Ig-like domain-containing protein [Elusimicrobiota bacterium]
MRPLLLLCAVLSASPAAADTRIKTVEYNFGGYYSNTDKASGSKTTFTSRTLKLPENGKVIRSAWLHYEGIAVSATNVSPLVIYFDAGAAANTARFTSVQYTAQSGESIRLFARADVTSVINAQLANLAAGAQFTAGVAITGPASNMHSMTLYVTYEYDDQSPQEVKTVRFPVYSDYVNGIAAYTAQQPAGTKTMQYLAEIADSGYSLQQQWVELRGFRQSNGVTTDGTIYVNINGGANEPTMNMDGSLIDSYEFRYLSNSDIMPGFSTGTVQNLNVVTVQSPVNTLGGEVVLTYIANSNSAVKTKTAKTFIGQGLTAVSNAILGAQVFLREEGITIKRAYARIVGSFDSTTNTAMPVDSSIGGVLMPQRSYAVQSQFAQISGYQFFHDMTSAAQAAGWSNGLQVGTTIYAAGSATGAQGMELIITYDYTNGAAHTDDYEVLAGNDTNGTVPSDTFAFGAWYPETEGSKTLREAYTYTDFLNNRGTTQDFNTTVDFNGNAPETVFHRTTTEDCTVNQFYQNLVQFSTFPAVVTANYALSSTRGLIGGRAAINYSFVPFPKLPVSLVQKANGAALAAGAWTNARELRFEGVLASSMNVDNIALVAEVKPNASVFDESALSTGPVFNYNTVAASSYAVVSGLVSGTVYHWRAAGFGDGGRGRWVNRGGNPDFGVDYSSPPAPAMAAIVPADRVNLNASPALLDWEDVTDIDGSGLKNYELQVATSSDFTTVTYSSSPLASMAQPAALAQNYYYWRVRALDNAGNTGIYSSTRAFRVDLSTPVIASNMGTGDQVWRNTNSGLYDVDFNDDGGSLISKLQVRATSGPAQTGTDFSGGWVDLSLTINATYYATDWALPAAFWTSLQSWTTNYISVRAIDYSTNTATLSDAFKVFKDTVPPVVTNGEAGGDLTWRKAGRSYNVDFADPYSKLAGAVYAARAAAGGTGAVLFSTTALAGVGGASYTADWSLNFAGLGGDSTNYITVEVYDIAGNTATVTDAFRVLKDTTPPSYTNNVAGGDLTWRKAAGTSYDFRFADSAGSWLNGAVYSAWTGPGNTGALKVSAAPVPGVSGPSYVTPWQVAFASLAGDSTNYITVEFYDMAGNTTTVTDAFRVLKDTTAPSVPSPVSPADGYKTNLANLSFDWGDSSDGAGSGVTNYLLQLATAADFTTISYASQPVVSEAFVPLAAQNTYYWRVASSDTAGNYSGFSAYRSLLVDLSTPTITDSQSGDSKWRDSNSGLYSVFFDDAGGSLLSYFQIKVTSGPSQTGTTLYDWTTIASGINSASYSSQWALPAAVWNSIPSGTTGYVSARAYDNVGNSTASANDLFYVLKDTVPATITDSQAGDDTWRNSGPGDIYNVSFADTGGSLLDSMQYTAWTGPGRTGTKRLDWTFISSGPAGVPSYAAPWGVSVSSWPALAEGYNYISVRVWDVAGTTTSLDDVFYVLKDTTAPSAQNGMAGGDALWQKDPGKLYNVDFYDTGGSLLNSIEYSVWSEPGQKGTQRKTWSPIVTAPLGAASYVSDWPVDFTSLAEGAATNYISLRFTDLAGNSSTYADAFYVSKDKTLPVIVDNQFGDDSWRSSSGTAYDVGFADAGGSLLSSFELKITTGPALTGTLVQDWTAQQSAINSASYPAGWKLAQAQWAALPAGISYVSARVTDNAGNQQANNDVFYVLKDTSPPSIADNQPGDSSWRAVSGLYNVDFADEGGSLLSGFQVKATTGPGQTGTLAADWTDAATGINAASYAADWQLPSAFWNLLPSGTSYISVRVFDHAGSTVSLTDAFYVLKDTSAPVIANGQAGDDAWRRFGGTAYSVGFGDAGAGLASAAYEAWTGPGLTGVNAVPLTAIPGVSGAAYSTPWSVDFSLLAQGTNYISVTVTDQLGHSAALQDAFRVLKDNGSPVITDNQAGDDVWRGTGGTLYNVDFGDLTSGLTTAQYRMTSLPAQGGTVLKDWTDIVSSPGGLSSYTADWPVDFAAIPSGTTGYVSVRIYDNAGNPAQVNDAFHVLKDTVPPYMVIVSTPADGYGPYLANPGAVFDVDFFDAGGSGIVAPQYRVTEGPGGTGVLVKDWTNIATLSGATYYTQNWGADFYSLSQLPATNYFSLRVTDLAGGTSDYADAFKLFRSSFPMGLAINQAGDAVWRTANNGTYNVDFFSNNAALNLSSFSVQAWTQPGRTGELSADWAKVLDINATYYYTDWSLPQPFFDSLKETTNYISVRLWNVNATSMTVEDVFYVRKDTSPPVITDLQGGDNTWRASAGTVYNIDFADPGSLLTTAQYRISSLPAQAGLLLKDWTDIVSSPAGQPSYTANWPVDFAALQSWTTGYVSVRAYNQAGLSASANDVFYVRKDTTPPYAVSLEAGATYYQSSNGRLYNVDFHDPGQESGLLRYQLRASTHTGNYAPYLLDWTDAANISGGNYASDWPLPAAIWDSLDSGATAYISVRVFDAALQSSDTYNAFSVWKDTAPPYVAVNQPGDDTWRLTDPGAVYDVDFGDLESGATTAQYRLYSGPGGTGTLLKDWTDVFGAPAGTPLYSANWAADFAAAREGANYVGVRAFDRGGLATAVQDAFYVLKDTTPPVIVGNQPGDYAWRGSPGTLYDVDFFDRASGLSAIEYRVSTAPALGYPVSDWLPANLLTGYPTYYADNWSVSFSTLAENTTNYISVRAYDRLGLVSVSSDVFKVFKDVTLPAIADNQPGDDLWRNSSGTLYNVSFADAGGSLLSRFQTRLMSGPAQTGAQIAGWTDILSGIGSASHSSPWALPDFLWQPLPEGQSYVSVRVYDNAGNAREISDVFYVRKDTTPPSIADYQGGDGVWRAANTAAYDVRFADTGGSLLEGARVKLTEGPAQTGAVIADWTPVLSNINAASYSTPWPLTAALWNAIRSGVTAYVSVDVADGAASTTTLSDAFYVLKDTVPPTAADLQSGDAVWRNSNAGAYAVHFADEGGSLLSKVQVKASSAPAGAGAAAFGLTDLLTGIGAASYPSDWQLTPALWSLLLPGTNYISARVYDNAGASSDYADVFYILKDTQPPSGTVTPPAFSGALGFNVPYSASDAGPAGVQYVKLYYTMATGVPYSWTQFGTTFSASPIAFTAPAGGTAGFRLVVYDRAGNKDETDPPTSDTPPEAATVVDLTPPSVVNNQTGDSVWRNAGGTLYNVDFSGGGGSLLSAAQYKVTSSPAQGGTTLKDWTYIAQNINAANYSADWAVDFAALKSSFNYVSVRVWNQAGTTTTASDVFYVKKDTEAPAFADNQAGDDVWRQADPGAVYNVGFNDPYSLLSKVQYSASSVPGGASGDIKGWTDIAAGISAASYSQSWGVDFLSLTSGVTAYISARAYDLAGNVAVSTDVFYVLKDTVPPAAADNQAGDDVWRASNSGLYNVDFADAGGSGLLTAQYGAWTSTGMAGAGLVPWTDISPSPAGLNSYTADWQLSAGAFALLQSGTSYVSVRVMDNAGSTTTLADVFYVRKDVSGPAISGNQAGDDAWRSANTGVYDVDFADQLSGLASFEVKVTTGLNQSGTVLADWTPVSALSGASYTANWALPPAVFAAMREGANQVSVRALDGAGNGSALSDVFYVRKDTSGPVITDNQAGDDVWRASNSGLYNVDFADDKSLAAKFQLKAMTGAGQTGTLLFDWTDAVAGINAASYTADWSIPQAQWDLLAPGTGYISVRAFDMAGSTSSLTDVFYVRKDTVPAPAIGALAGVTSAEGVIALSWTAPDDGGAAVSSYLVKFSSYIVIAAGNFDTADTYAQSWTPVGPGSPESYNLTGLAPNTAYYIAVKSVDRAGNISAISNTATASAGPDTTPPGAITDLAAQQGGFDGQIALSWTAVGDNGVSIGTATAYQVRYRTDQAITSALLWDGANIYAQAWVPQYPGVPEAQGIDNLTPGVTYYWAIKAVDEVVNTSPLSNSPSAPAKVGEGTPGMFMFGNGTGNTPYVRKWTPPSFAGVQTSLAANAAAGAVARHVIVRASPLRNEKMAGILFSDGVLQLQRYNGLTGQWTNEWSTTTIGATNSAYRGFDIAYEQNTGRAVVLYQGAAVGTLYYNIYDGSSWTGAQTLAAGDPAAAAVWVRLEARPKSDELMAAFSNLSSNQLTAARWTGSLWSDVTTIAANLGLTTYQNFDVAWESLSGHCLVSYGGTAVTGKAITWLWNGISWAQFTTTEFTFIGANGNSNWLRLASDPNSNYIGAASLDSGRDWNAAIWDGTGWFPSATENGSVARNANQSRTIDAAWTKDGRFVVASAHRTLFTVLYSYWSQAGGWATTLAAAYSVGNWSNLVYGVELEPDTKASNLMLTGWSSSRDLRSAAWSGSVFTLDPTPHTTTISAQTYMPAMLAIDRHDIVPPTVTDNQPGDDAWRGTNTGVYNIDAADTGGSHLRGIQTRIYSGPNQTGALLEGWTTQVSTSGVDVYTADWPLSAGTWAAMKEGYNYVTVRSTDGSDNTSLVPITDAFYVKKDTTPPTLPPLSLPADGAFLKDPAVFFDWAGSSDLASGVAAYELQVATSADFAAPAYSAAPSVSESTSAALASGMYYWRVRARDLVYNYSAYTSTRVVYVDTAPPAAVDLQAGDDVWRNASGAVYAVHFADAGGSLLDAAAYAVYSGPGRTGAQLVPFSGGVIASGIAAPAYNSDWALSPANWALLPNGTSYVSVQSSDRAGNAASSDDVFYIRKDVSAPVITDNQPGDDVWRAAPGALYNVDFADAGGSQLSKFQLKITSGPGQTGTVLSDWFDRVSGIGATSYSADFELGASTWTALPEGQAYVSARAWDNAGNSSTLTDVFYVRKDTSPPSAVAGVSPADGKVTNSASPLLDWTDAADAGSGISGYEIYVATSQDFAVNYASAATAGSQYPASLPSGLFYWRARARDNAGNYGAYGPAFSVRVDTAPPAVADAQAGDDAWRSAGGTLYNVSFADAGGSHIDSLEYSAWSGPARTGVNHIPWAVITSTPLGADSYSSPWGVDFSLLGDGTNYVSVRVWDAAGSTVTAQDVFYVKKDAYSPAIVDNQPGDDVWRAAPGALFNVDFQDTGASLLSKFQLKITSGPNQTGTVLSDWFDRSAAINSASYTQDFDLGISTWLLLPEGTSYISARVWDNAGNSASLSDVFYVRKDTTPPSITDSQAGDDVWRPVNSGSYAVGFADTGGSRLSYFQVKATTGPAQTGTITADWTTVASGLSAGSYPGGWTLPQTVFDSLASGLNYLSVRVYDGAGLSAALSDAFYVRKSTAAPRILDNQAGDDVWRNAPGTLYDVDFEDTGASGLSAAQYKVTSAPGQGGTLVKDWTYIASGINAPSYTADWAVDFAALAEGVTNYVSVRVWDVAGATTAVSDVFYVRKDVTAPSVANNQLGDAAWRSSSGTVYNVDFADAGGSGLAGFEVKVTTGPGLTGTVVADWYPQAASINSNSYTADWALPASTFTALPEGPGMVSVRVYDNAGNSAELDDAFYVRKDTTPPSAPAAVSPADLAPRATLSPLLDWTDSSDGSSGIAGYELRAATSASFSPVAYSAAPAASQQAASLPSGATWYWQARARDNAGNYSGYSAYYRVLADTVAPVVTDSQPGETNWRNSDPGAVYNVPFSDDMTGLDTMQYSAWTGPGQTGSNSVPWTVISSGTPRLAYPGPWSVNFSLLAAGTNYISARAWDAAGSTATRSDVFNVLKDTSAP